MCQNLSKRDEATRRCARTSERPRRRRRRCARWGDSFKKVVLVRDIVKPIYDDDGILTMSVFDFLLDPTSLEG